MKAAALRRPASAPESRIPARPQFFWALRPEDVPDNMRSTKGARAKENSSPAYAHDPTSWLIHRHREGHLCAAAFEADNRAVPRCPVERALQKPMGRPQSAPQILKERQKLRQLQDKKVKTSRLNASQSSPAICPEAETAKRLGYWPGLPRKTSEAGALAVPEAAGIRPSTGHRTDAEASSRTKSVDAEERRLPGAAEEAQRCLRIEFPRERRPVTCEPMATGL
mmetsp:Transcript_45200/g.98346  ORF Transcript_45200/g.98346 Transcript_45200/m.98346 type:complete len:224 (+) Transcript_45200:66-737(+)